MTSAGARNLVVVLLAAAVVALPFVLRREDATSAWAQGDPVLVIISPHHEAIRYEFERGFSRWHRQHHGAPVRIDWRNIGGTTEILQLSRPASSRPPRRPGGDSRASRGRPAPWTPW